MTQEEQAEFIEFKQQKKKEEAKSRVQKIECDLLSPYGDKNSVRDACKAAERLEIGAVCVLPNMVKACVGFLGPDPKCSLIAVVSYPHGGDTTEVKAAAVKRAVKDGIDEAEVCAPLAFIAEGNFAYLKRECKKIKRAAKNRPVRLCLDAAVLNSSLIAKASRIAADAGIDCIRINNFNDSGVLTAVKNAVKDKCLIKTDGVESEAQFSGILAMGAHCVSCKNAQELASLILSQAESL